MMKKCLSYEFLPSKADEACNRPFQVKRTLVEIRDLQPPPIPRVLVDPSNPWEIRKAVTEREITRPWEVEISQGDMFDHVLRYWSLDMANYVVQGNKCSVVLMDYTDAQKTIRFQGENVYVKSSGCNDDRFVLGLKDVIMGRCLNAGDEIGLYLDIRPGAHYGTFGFKVLRRPNN